MKRINVIPLRSTITSDEDILNREQANYLDQLSTKIGVDLLVNQESSINLFFIETGGTEEAILDSFAKYSPPFYLLTTAYRNSLPAALEIGAYLDNQNLAYQIIHGSIEQVSKSLLAIIDVQNKKDTSFFRLGVIGKPSDWLIASNINREYARAKYQMAFIDISYGEFTSEIDKNSYENSTKIENIRKIIANTDYLEGALNIYGAIKRLIIKHDLQGFSIRCFDLLGLYRNTACLALALINDEGISAGCEGDLPILAGMHLVKKLLNEDSFQANPSSIDEVAKTITFAHCTVPFSMCQKHTFLTHFESDLGIGIRGEMKLGPCTIFRLSSNLKKALIEEGEIIANLSRDDLCRTQIVIKLENGLNKILNKPLGNHHLIIYGHHKSSLLRFLKTIDSCLELV